MSDWFVMMTAPQRELAAAEALRDRGFTVYVPTVRKRIGRRNTVQALFNRYLFCRYWIPWHECDPEHKDCIRDKAGRRMLIGPVIVCGRHEPIAEHEVGKIAEAAARLELESLPKPSLQPGDIGIMRSGPFEGKSGEIVSVSKGEAEIALRIFNSVRTVRARLDKLEAA